MSRTSLPLETNFTMQSLKVDHPIIQGEPTLSFGGWQIWGFVVGQDVKNDLAELEGSWIAIKENEAGQIEIRADASASVRVYTAKKDEVIYCYGDLDDLAQVVGAGLNEGLKAHFDETGYFFAHRTCYTEVYRVPPLCTITWGEEESPILNDHFYSLPPESSLFGDLESRVNHIDKDEKIILMFSGGADSLAIALALKKQNREFTCVFLDDGKRDPERVRASLKAMEFGLDFEAISVKDDGSLESEIQRLQKYDKHYASLHFYGARQIARQFGKNILVLNGQGADTLFGLGPTEASLQSLLKRLALYSNEMAFIFSNVLLALLYRRQMLLSSKNEDSYFASFLVFRNYLFGKTEHSIALWDSVFMNESFKCSAKLTKLLSIKRLGFLAGSDNQVVYNSLRCNGIMKIFLPFSSARAIAFAKNRMMQNPSELVWGPKSFINNYVKENL